MTAWGHEMYLTAFTDYTLRTLVYVALQPSRMVTVAEIAEAYGISANHLMKVVQQLGEHGDVRTARGQGGGIRLARRPEHINIGAVVRRTEPNLSGATCFCGKDSCVISEGCLLAEALNKASAAFVGVLEGYTLADVVANRKMLSDLLHIRVDENAFCEG